ncbi:MAG: Gfo/Idh/MocA family oxidoreductase [Phycisphaeraceae bacterium]|nr:Gfo/Idh/MocA family oxidoreductase [Phycisphaeraceae bacterium]
MQTRYTRRTLMKTAAVGAGALALGPTANVLGANGKVRVAFIGLGGRGKGLLGSFSKLKNVTVAGLCDVDEKNLGGQANKFPDAFATTDLRKILERKDIDAIVSASPNHWHSLLTIWACQTGKHVYMEKPVSHTVYESRQMAKAARKYGRIVSAGFQNRSCGGLTPFFETLHEGKWGKVNSIRVLTYRNRKSIGKLDKPLTPPKEVDYNMWLGPAADRPIMRPRFHYDWHWDYNTGDGDLGNQGPHETDLARWALKDPMALPDSVECMGGRFAWDDAGNTPNMLLVRMMYGDVPITCETINLKRPAYKGIGVGVIINCEKGEFRGGRGGGKVLAPDGSELAKWKGNQSAHYGKFIDAIQKNDKSVLTSEIESAGYSSDLAHVSNIAYKVGRPMPQEQVMERFGHDDDLKQSIARYGKIRTDNGVDAGIKWTYGSKLTFDNKQGRFVGEGAKAANPLMTREYRKGFEVTGEV